MNIRKAMVVAVTLFAAASVCQAGRLAPTPSDYERDDQTRAQDSDTSGSGDEAEDVEQLDLSSLEAGDTLSFSIDEDLPETIGGLEVLSSFLPDDVELEWTGKKLKAPKAGKVKYSKKEEDFVDTKDSDNPSGLSVKVNKKKGTVSGTFKIYVAKSEKKLKSYKAKFSGKVGGSLEITLKKKVIGTASITQ